MIHWARKSDLFGKNSQIKFDRNESNINILSSWERIWISSWEDQFSLSESNIKALSFDLSNSSQNGNSVISSTQSEYHKFSEIINKLDSDTIPGNRSIMTIRFHNPGFKSKNELLDYYDAIGNSTLRVEYPHLSDPMPGDPRISRVWLEDEEVLCQKAEDNKKIYSIGLILRKFLTLDDLFDKRFKICNNSKYDARHFPMIKTEYVPIPNNLVLKSDIGLQEIMAEYLADLNSAVEIINNLIFGETIRIL